MRNKTSRPGQDLKVYAQFRVSYYINHAWEQIRELTYLAASEDSREILIETADFRKVVRRTRFDPPKCSTEEMLRTTDSLLRRSVRQDFVSALLRRTFMLRMESTGVYPESSVDETIFTSVVPLYKMVPKLDKDKKSPRVAIQELAHAVYEK
ncbi:hypothetical protein L207DRAFT_592629 [Hyaloscypha variabilis F]|uniref:Uncharacterized protein n=1 Tax=Hyaloscypha variabilis (strain UAMH 11265 / GT02V1 / F) TaxID=1149755 RepID=A0A2J6QV83_HYAVF|nr:hypothetical protein L207DRAFT_592629 [Hyaloscypha variabilis F]